MTETTEPKTRGRPPTGRAVTAAERQARYRDRQRAKLAQAQAQATGPEADELRRAIELAQAEIARLNAEGDRLALKVDQLQRALAAKENAHARTAKIADKVVTERDAMRDRIAEQDRQIAALQAELARYRPQVHATGQ
ncbi:hypothetical protein ABC977_04655 [Thioalkalicoccus limnaeus]|uniref:Uncharacterized protein n=1 Tax=Thioalkalicoccus limnaeus TaxID=120681 RepID=A0ABV4BB52_9GAMM